MPRRLVCWYRGLAADGGQENALPPLAVRSGHAFFQTPGLVVPTHSVRDGLAGSEVLTSSGSAPSSGSRGVPSPLQSPPFM